MVSDSSLLNHLHHLDCLIMWIDSMMFLSGVKMAKPTSFFKTCIGALMKIFVLWIRDILKTFLDGMEFLGTLMPFLPPSLMSKPPTFSKMINFGL